MDSCGLVIREIKKIKDLDSWLRALPEPPNTGFSDLRVLFRDVFQREGILGAEAFVMRLHETQETCPGAKFNWRWVCQMLDVPTDEELADQRSRRKRWYWLATGLLALVAWAIGQREWLRTSWRWITDLF